MKYKLFMVILAAAVLSVTGPSAKAQYQMQVYGLWHCYSDACSWASVPNMTTFDTNNHWIIDRNMDNTFHPSVNVVVLSFVDPIKLMNLTNDSTTVNGIPIGMTTAVVNYFQSRGIRVMMSIGGFSFVSHWDKALKANPTQLGINAANAAKQFNVGMEIDCEKSSNPNLTGMLKFVSAYRSVVPYDATGSNYAARLTIDLGNDDQYLTALANYATTIWLSTSNPVLDYANAGSVAEYQCFHTGNRLAATRSGLGRQRASAGARQTHGKPLGSRQQSQSQLHRRLQQLGPGDRLQLRLDHPARWSRNVARHSGIHVLGWRMSRQRHRVYLSAQHLSGRNRSRRHDL